MVGKTSRKRHRLHTHPAIFMKIEVIVAVARYPVHSGVSKKHVENDVMDALVFHEEEADWRVRRVRVFGTAKTYAEVL